MAPNQTPGSGRRKRARPEDDLASSPAPSPSTVATSAKRRRLNNLADSPRSTPKGFSAITSAIGGALGRSVQRNGTRGKLADEQHDTTAESSYEVPTSDGESEGILGKPKKLDFGRLPKSLGSAKSLYDVPDSGDELDPVGRTPKGNRGRNPTSPTKRRIINGDGESASVRSTAKKQDAQGAKVPINIKTGKSRSSRVEDPSAPPDTSGTKDHEGENGEIDDGDDEEEQDDEVCAMCSKPDSEPPNEIIFCEVCDTGFHQKCYNVPVIPEGDWICRTCSQEDALPGRTDITEKTAITSTDIPVIPNFEQHLQQMRRVLLDRCSGNRRIKLCGQSEAYDKAYQLVEQTVLAGEGNSMMIIGGRGCGKTTMMEEILSNLRAEHAEEFHVIRLNGFIHTDDKLALKEIWRQLGKEMEIEDDLVNKTNNYADTMASLLALLSHPEEITGAEDGVTSKSVVFIIDEFELFATHARQTLLYNLFDIAQARKAPIAVLGLTTRIDVVESLEKRVKSRFSHRYVYLSLPKSLPAYWEICKQGLIVDKDDLEAEGFDTDLQGLYEFHDYWNKKIEALRQTPAFEDHLEYQYYTTKSVPAFLASCIQPLSALSISLLNLTLPSSTDVITLEPQEPKLQLLAALSDLELALLISAARLDIVAHTDTVNFAMAYDEYSAQMGRQRVQTAGSGLLALGAGARVWSRSVAAVAWERLVSLGLLIPAGIGGRSNAAHGGLEGKMWKMDVLLEEISSAVELPGFLAKWCSQI
ncbi:hypothetical protein GQX73_g96 [Xylaria multiplex]|uniref:Origin recognition complex subunit 4 n=1 Tax=Xylaria multiplex TaxID=323545 RepID=A0A7C8IVR2_9PEZI|nr:hypothetical protein GQX73_g96 [Xylaria multiplex]